MTNAKLVKALTQNTLEDVAPEECFLVAEYSPEIRHDGQTATGARGFGAEAAVLLLLPYVYRFFEKMLDRLAARAADGGFDLLRRWLGQSEPVPDAKLIEAVQAELRAAGLDDVQAARVAPAVVKTLSSHRAQMSAP